MSLATRCTACGTVFRVVQDQLKVSEGWVRCGRCNEVFNALEGLFDLERDTPPTLAAPETAEPSAPAPEIDLDLGAAGEDTLPYTDLELPFDEGVPQAMSPQDDGQFSTPAGRVNERDRLEFPDAQFDPDMLLEDTVLLRSSASESESPAIVAHDPAAQDLPSPPDFIRHAQQRERWRSPTMLALQACALVVLLAVLALQVGTHFRNTIAARWPSTTALLSAWCGATGCKIEAPSRIEDVAVESSALTRAGVPDAFRLAVVLRNHGTTTVAMPSIDLSLTDANGQLIARRMLAPQDFRAVPALIGPGAESSLQLTLAAGGARVTGYTVEVFYP